jgi:hypothetical protein
MKFFTVDVYNSYKDDSALNAASHDYTEYLKSLECILPAHLLTLARLPGVDDGLVVDFAVWPPANGLL